MSEANEYTGNKYKCNSLTEISERNWNSAFEIGEIYNEIKNENLPSNVLMLEPKGVNWKLVGLYVDAGQFELVEDENK